MDGDDTERGLDRVRKLASAAKEGAQAARGVRELAKNPGSPVTSRADQAERAITGGQRAAGLGESAAGVAARVADIVGAPRVVRTARDVAAVARGVGDVMDVAAMVVDAARSIGDVDSESGPDAPEVHYRLTTRDAAGVDERLNGNAWTVDRADIQETLNCCYVGVLQISTDHLDIDLSALVGANGELEIQREPLVRHIPGVISEVDYGGVYERRLVFHAKIVPAFSLCQQHVVSRIYQGRTVVEILDDLLETHLGPYARTFDRWLDSERYKPREYCVQYQESVFDFCSRLMEEEGIGYHFRRDAKGNEMLTLTDDNAHALRVQTLDDHAVPFILVGGSLSSAESVYEFHRVQRLAHSGITVRDHDWTDPLKPVQHVELEIGASGNRDAPREHFDHSHELSIGGFQDGVHGTGRYTENDGARQADLRRKLQRYGESLCSGVGYVTGFQPGMKFELTGHRQPELNKEYLIVGVQHHKGAPPGLEDNSAAQNFAYYNTFDAIPLSVEYVPPRVQKKPRIHGIHSARVCGPGEEERLDEPYTDGHGRIKLHFHWDPEGALTKNNTCWVRVLQPMAGLSTEGKNWGHQFIPYPGMEAIVSFVNGDPDRPVVMGTLYNGENHTAFEVPDIAKKMRSGIRTVRDNELSFMDLPGAEEIYVHARKDYKELIEHDQQATVRNNQTVTVDGSQTSKIKGAQSISAGSQSISTGSRSLSVSRNETVMIGGKADVTVKDQYKLAVQKSLLIECGGSSILLTPEAITLKNGGSSVKIEAPMITMVSALIKIN